MSDFALRFGLALIVVTVALAAILISRRNYAKSADFERSVGTLRLEFGRLVDDAQAATIKSVAKTIRDNIFSVTKPIDSTLRDLGVRLARLEQQHADAVAATTAGTQILDVRLARLEEHGDATAVQNLDIRLAKLEEHDHAVAIKTLGGRVANLEDRDDGAAIQSLDRRVANLEERDDDAALRNLDSRVANLEERVDGTATEAAEARKQSLEANERIISQLTALEQRLSALDDQLSLFKHTIDGAAKREQEIASSLEAINGRIADDKTRVDELFPRLALGEKANKDLGVLISLCVTRIKTVNVNAAEIARRLSDLETHVRSKTERLEERLNAADKPAQSANEIEKSIDDAATKPAEEADPVAAKAGVKDCAIIEGPRILAEAAPSETKAKQEDPSVGKPAEAHAT